MILVLGLIAVTMGILALNVRTLLHEQRFRAEAATVLEALRLAQDLMLISESDVSVNFTKDQKGGLKVQLQLEKPLTKNWSREVVNPKKLQAVQFVEFEDRKTGDKQVNQLELSFFSNGAVMSQGVLRIADHPYKPTYQTVIHLAGYPKPIISGSDDFDSKGEKDMKQRLTEEVQQEIYAITPAKK